MSDKKKILHFLADSLSPLALTWGIALYIHILHLLRIFEIVESQILLHLLFLPIIPLEFFCRRVGSAQKPAGRRRLIMQYLPFVGRIIFWFVLFVVWAIILGAMGAIEAPWQKWVSLHPYLIVYLIARLGGYPTVIAAVLWIGLYYLAVVRKKTGRIFFSLVIPAALGLGLFYQFNAYGGTAALVGIEEIKAQPGVSLVLDYNRIAAEAVAWPDPRDIFASDDSQIVYASFGASFRKIDTAYAAVVRYDIAADRLDYFNSYNLRKMAFSGSHLYVAPALWSNDNIFELSTDDLKLEREIPNQIGKALDWWEPMDLYVDEQTHKLYLSDNLTPVLISYDLQTGRRRKILDLQGQGIIGIGGNVSSIKQSPVDRTLYMAGGPGENLLAVAPDSLDLLRRTRFDYCVMGSALAHDPTTDRLYLQCGAVDALYEIDAKDFRVIRKYTGEFHSRALAIDNAKNCIYELGFGSGTLFALDRESGRKVWSLDVGAKPNSMYLDPQRKLWINSKAGILRIDLDKVWAAQG